MALTEEEKYQYWLSYAQNDMDSAEIMLQTGRWFYTVTMRSYLIHFHSFICEAGIPIIPPHWHHLRQAKQRNPFMEKAKEPFNGC